MTSRVLVFSDFTCPFSYVTETALRQLAREVELEVEYRSFELFPAPTRLPSDVDGGASEAVRPLAADLGLAVEPPLRWVRTRKAHEAARLAREHGCEDAFRDGVFAAYFTHGRDIGRIDVLTEIGTGVGLDRSAVKVVLDVDRYTAEVESEQTAARGAGIESTPTLLIRSGGATRGLLGAQTLDQLRAAITAS